MKKSLEKELRQLNKDIHIDQDFKNGILDELRLKEANSIKKTYRNKGWGLKAGYKVAGAGLLLFLIVALLSNLFSIDRLIREKELADNLNNKIEIVEGEKSKGAKEDTNQEDNQPIYEEDDVLLLVCVNDKFGFVNLSGDVVIEPQFDYATSFNEDDLAMVMNYDGEEEVYGLLGKEGLLTEVDLWDIGEFSEGLAKVRSKENKYGFIDNRGNWLIEPIYDIARDFSEGKAAVGFLREGKGIEDSEYVWGYIDSSGNEIVKPIYASAQSFSEGLAYVTDLWTWREAKGYYLNEKGEVEISLPWKYLGEYGGGEFAENGTAIISRIDEDDLSISRSGVINRKGELIIPFEYSGISEAVDGFRIAIPLETADMHGRVGRVGLLDNQGKWVIEANYYEINNLEDGLMIASVIRDGREYQGVLRVDGSWLYEPINPGVFSLKDDMVVFIEDSGIDGRGIKMSLYDLEGNQLLDGESYYYIDIISEDLIKTGISIDWAEGIIDWTIRRPDGSPIMENYNIYDLEKKDDDNYLAYLIEGQNMHIGLINEGLDRWILEPRHYYKVFFYRDGFGGALRIIEEIRKDILDSEGEFTTTDIIDEVIFVTEIFNNKGEIVYTSKEETMKADKFYNLEYDPYY